MLDTVIRLSLRYRMLVLMASLVAVVYGSYLAAQMPIDIFPDLDRPRVVVITEVPGWATEEVEALVTQPIEIALMGATGVQSVRSQTTSGLNVLYVEFDWSTEIRDARQTVSERLATLEGMLPEAVRPQMTPPSSIMGQILVAGIYVQDGPSGGRLVPVGRTGLSAELIGFGDEAKILLWQPTDRRAVHSWQPIGVDAVVWMNRPPRIGDPAAADLSVGPVTYQVEFPSESTESLELRTLADWIIRPRLLQVPGVAEVFMQGGDRKQYQVLLDPTALLEYDVTVQAVEQSLRESNLNTSGGYAITGETERPIRILGRLGPGSKKVIDDLESIPVARRPKRSVPLGQIAEVTEGAELKRGEGSVNGRSGVVFTVVKQPHVDTRRLTDDVAAAFAEVETSLPPNIVINSELFRLKNFIDRGIFNVAEALVIGGTLVIIVLFLFLLNFRTTFITLTAIPMSLILTTFVFRAIGWLSGSELSINVMTLGGIAVAMGELVDDAIVDVENIFRRLKENSRSQEPRAPIRVVYEASKEIRGAILFGTAVVILVFLPLFALSGVGGRLFAPLGLAYIVSILSSFFVSLTVTPVLSYYLLPQAQATHRDADGFVLRSLKSLAEPLIRTSMAVPGKLLLLTWVLVGFAAWQVSQIGRNFLPAFDEGSVQVNVTLPPGSSLQASNEVAGNIDDVFLSMQKSPQNPDGLILNFVRRTGRAEMDEHASPVNFGEYLLSMNPETDQKRGVLLAELLAQIREEVPGVDVEVEQPLAHLISHMISGVYAQIAIKIHGDDLDTLLALADQAEAAIRDVPGITPPIVEPIRFTPEWHVRLRGEDLAVYGLTRQYVADVLRTSLEPRFKGRWFLRSWKDNAVLTYSCGWRKSTGPTMRIWAD